jgi:hypothetical protein
VKIAKAIVDEQYAAAKRTYNIDAPERLSTSLQAKRKELKGYTAWNKKRSQSQFTDTRDELIKYRNIQDPPDGQDPLDW